MDIMGQSIDQSSVANLGFTLEVTGIDAQGTVTIAGTLDDTDLGGLGGMPMAQDMAMKLKIDSTVTVTPK